MALREAAIKVLGLPAESTNREIIQALISNADPSWQPHMRLAAGVPVPSDVSVLLAEALQLREQLGDRLAAETDDPQAKFHELAERTSKVLGISLSDAYSRVSAEAPTLAQRARERAWL